MPRDIGTDQVLLELEHVDMRFGGVHAVRDMSFRIMDNALTGIIGPNGAGKTTVFNIVSGVYNPTAGSIWFRDQDITPMAAYQVNRLGIAHIYLFEALEYAAVTLILLIEDFSH